MNKEQIIQGIYNEYMGKRDQISAELGVYLDSPAGVGEHGEISAVIKEKIEEVDRLNGITQTMRNLFMDASTDEKVSQINAEVGDLAPEDS